MTSAPLPPPDSPRDSRLGSPSDSPSDSQQNPASSERVGSNGHASKESGSDGSDGRKGDLPEGGLPERDDPESGLPESGLPESGLPESGLPESQSLRDALAAAQTQADGVESVLELDLALLGPDLPGGDAPTEPTRVEGATFCDATLLATPWARELWVDLALAAQDVAASAAVALPAHVRSAALRAMDRSLTLSAVALAPAAESLALPSVPSLAPEPEALTGEAAAGLRLVGAWSALRASPAHRAVPRSSLWAPKVMRAAAALLLVGLALGALMGGETAVAKEGLSLSYLARMDVSRGGWFSQIEPGRVAGAGEVFAPQGEEWLSLSPSPLSRVVVGAGDRLAVDRASVGQGFALRLEQGEAQLQVGGDPLVLELGRYGRLVLREGTAHVVLQSGSMNTAQADAAAPAVGAWPALALLQNSVAEYEPAHGGKAVTFQGPTRVLLSAQGVEAEGEPALSLFRELRFFGGELPEPASVAAISARRWQVLQGSVRRHRRHLELRDAKLWRLGVALPESIEDGRRLRVQLRAPAGTRVSLLGAAVGTCASTQVAEEGRVREPGLCSVALDLPERWFETLDAQGLVLAIELPEDAELAGSVLFEGAFVEFGSASPDSAESQVGEAR